MVTPNADLQERLEELIVRCGVPGAAIAVLHEGRLMQAAAGTANLATGVAVTPDTLFQIGSITKVYTATLVLQLVEAGAIELDAPVTSYLPEVCFGDATVADVLTVRQLLSHTSGLEGDFFDDFGRGDDAVACYVAALSRIGQLHPPGGDFSYCNSGWVVLGRLIERLSEQPFHMAMATKLTGPAGLSDTVLLPEEAILRRVAVGHLPHPDGAGLIPAPRWSLGHAAAPAGSLTCATAADVVRFAGVHLADGRSADGTEILTPASVKAMQQPQTGVPDPFTFGHAWGLGWALMSWDGAALFGHDGITIGQWAFLRVCPEANLAVALLTNGGAPRTLYRALVGEIFSTCAGVCMPELPGPRRQHDQLDPSRYSGRYARHDVILDIVAQEDGLHLEMRYEGALADLMPQPPPMPLIPAGGDMFLAMTADTPAPVVFYKPSDEDGRPDWVHFGGCAHHPVATGTNPKTS